MTDKAAENRQAREARKAAHLQEMYDRYMARFRAAGGEDALSLARSLHGEMDEVLARDRKRSANSDDISCHKGCSHCCHGPVEIWPQEAALLVEFARANGIGMDPARLERQSRYTPDTWRRQPAADRACGFLGADGACKVYESRPNACRKVLVTSEPALCDADKYPAERVGRWFSWEAEVMESAALETLGRVMMPGAVLAALKAENGKGGGT